MREASRFTPQQKQQSTHNEHNSDFGASWAMVLSIASSSQRFIFLIIVYPRREAFFSFIHQQVKV
jgi:hypothetical protein